MSADELNVNCEIVSKILVEDFFMRKFCAKMVTEDLSKEQKFNRIFITQDCFEQVEGVQLSLVM